MVNLPAWMLALLSVIELGVAGEWISMFDGRSLAGWRVNAENPATFSVADGAILVRGPRAHLFYGEQGDASFRDFEFECEVQTEKGANSGIFFHTLYQDRGWPTHGYEAQVNVSHSDWRKSGSLYDFQDLKSAAHADGEWVRYRIEVRGRTVTISIQGQVVNRYTEPADHTHETKRLGQGTIALQGHDPQSVVRFRKLRIRRLDPIAKP